MRELLEYVLIMHRHQSSAYADRACLQDERESKVKIKREARDDEPRRRRVARPREGSEVLEDDGEGGFRRNSTPMARATSEVIELD